MDFGPGRAASKGGEVNSPSKGSTCMSKIIDIIEAVSDGRLTFPRRRNSTRRCSKLENVTRGGGWSDGAGAAGTCTGVYTCVRLPEFASVCLSMAGSRKFHFPAPVPFTSMALHFRHAPPFHLTSVRFLAVVRHTATYRCPSQQVP